MANPRARAARKSTAAQPRMSWSSATPRIHVKRTLPSFVALEIANCIATRTLRARISELCTCNLPNHSIAMAPIVRFMFHHHLPRHPLTRPLRPLSIHPTHRPLLRRLHQRPFLATHQRRHHRRRQPLPSQLRPLYCHQNHRPIYPLRIRRKIHPLCLPNRRHSDLRRWSTRLRWHAPRNQQRNSIPLRLPCLQLIRPILARLWPPAVSQRRLRL